MLDSASVSWAREGGLSKYSFGDWSCSDHACGDDSDDDNNDNCEDDDVGDDIYVDGYDCNNGNSDASSMMMTMIMT